MKSKNYFLCAIIIMMATMFTLNAQVYFQPPPVGAIPGAIDVSPTGAATYSIPIEVVPGTQGMQPNLSIVYNSMGGMGLLGMKWNLGGLSSITRCGQTPYYDNKISTLVFSRITNNVELDGERLIKTATINANGVFSEFATERENFTKVYSYGVFANGNPFLTAHFKAYTDDGSIIEYGNTADSKHNLSVQDGTVLSWNINKITDANGNYMTFHYNKSYQEIWIESIEYTGNGSMQPYAKVEFAYTTLPDNLGKNTFYINSYSLQQTKLLQTITIKYGNSAVRKYQFNYNKDDAGERTVHLKEIIMTEYDDKGAAVSLNPTTIEWGNKNFSVEKKKINALPTGKTLSGDFYGDGYANLLIHQTVSNRKGWKLYIYNPLTNDFYEDQAAADINTVYDMLFAYDINGDGKDELIIGTKTNDTYSFKIISLPTKTQIGSTITFENLIGIDFGDFDGNGTTDILFATAVANATPECYKVTVKKMEKNQIVNLGTPLFFESIKEIKVLDVNGNGKTNYQIIKDDGTSMKDGTSMIYEFNGSAFQSIFQGDLSLPGGFYSTKYYGDVNGDGITDVIAYCYKVGLPSEWRIYISKGINSYEEYVLDGMALNTAENGYSPKYKIMVADLNNDGKDDIIQMIYVNNNNFNVLFSKGWANGEYFYKKEEFEIPESYSSWEKGNVAFADFNGNGNLDLILKNTTATFARIVYDNYDPFYEFVKEIKDGMGEKTNITYIPKYLSFTASSLALHKKVCLILPSKLQTSNGIGGVTELQFSYRVPWYSFLRRTFLGFYEFVTKNTIDNTISVDSLFFVPDNLMIPNQPVKHEILLPKRQSHTVNGYRVNETYYSFDTIPLPNKRYILHAKSNTLYDYLSNSKIGSSTTLENGRIKTSTTNTYNASNSGSYLHSETNTFTYETITLNGYQKKTVPKTILSTQQYGSSGLIIADTTTYSYYTDSANKGRLKSMRQGNIDGSITTTYENYTNQGVYQKKTVSAQGVPSRSETYTYETYNRFITQIKNELGHTINFSYNPVTGDKTWEKDANGLETNYKYDVFGQLKQIDYPDGTNTKTITEGVTSTSMPDAVYFTQIFSTGKPNVEIYYDVLGREVGRWDDGISSYIQYNAKGQVVSTSSPPSWSEYTYDNLGRVIEEKAPYTHLTYSYNNRKTTVTDNLREISSYTDYDALGRIIQANDEGGTINYTYEIVNVGGKKRHKTTVSNNTDNSFTTIISDLWGNRLAITEPNAGTITSEYNKFNELTKQTDANGNITLYVYDQLGRITSKIYTNSPNSIPDPPSVFYIYDTGNKAIGKLSKIEMGGETAESFTYDNLGRLSSHSKNGTGKFSYTYNANGQLQTLKYPGDGFAVNYSYTSTGKLKDIRRSDDNSLIYEVNNRNQYHQPTECNYGHNRINPICTQYTYNYYGLVTRIRTTSGMVSEPHELDDTSLEGDVLRGNGVIMDYNYAYNNLGLMASRADIVVNQQETYTYDNLDRLTKNVYYDYKGNKVNQTFDYSSNGNITQNSQVGNYTYNSEKPHAVTQITGVNENLISENECEVAYNLFNQPKKITEGDYELELSYGANQQRNKAILKINDTVVSTRYYFNKYYEREVDSAGKTLYYHYIYGDNGVVALHIANRTILADTSNFYDPGEEEGEIGSIYRSFDKIPIDLMYYIHTDHLGSYCAITNEAGQVVQRNSFDPWGNYAFEKRYDISIITPPPDRGDTLPDLSFPITARGFTGHEHYPFFKIINMNGRLYDPVIARFFSPDKYVANSSFTQDFNRYTYARNNPLMYTDPDGEFIFTALFTPIGLAPLGILIDGACWGAVIKGATYTISAAIQPGGLSQNWNAKDFGRSLAVGAVTGFVSAGMGLIAPTFSYTTNFWSNLPKYIGKAAYATTTAVVATGTGMLVDDWLDDGIINNKGINYLKEMGYAGLSAGVLSFGKSMIGYATWDRFTNEQKVAKINAQYQRRFGVEVRYDANLTDEGLYTRGNNYFELGPSALQYERNYAFSAARHELQHFRDRNVVESLLRGRSWRDFTEIRAYKAEMRSHRPTFKDYLHYIDAMDDYGYRGLGTFIPNFLLILYNSVF